MIIRYHLKNGLRLDEDVTLSILDRDNPKSITRCADDLANAWQGATLIRIDPMHMPATIVPVCNILRIEVLNEQPDPA